jgi:hypothetical protein
MLLITIFLYLLGFNNFFPARPRPYRHGWTVRRAFKISGCKKMWIFSYDGLHELKAKDKISSKFLLLV